MEVKIQIPDNCELIKDGDTYIVKEKKNNKPKTWSKFCGDYPIQPSEYYIDSKSRVLPIEYYIDNQSKVLPMTMSGAFRDAVLDKNCCTSKEEAEAFLALMQLRQLRKAWVGDWKQEKSGAAAVIVYNLNEDKIIVDYGTTCMSRPLSFPTQLMAYDFLGCFKHLCKTAKILL